MSGLRSRGHDNRRSQGDNSSLLGQVMAVMGTDPSVACLKDGQP